MPRASHYCFLTFFAFSCAVHCAPLDTPERFGLGRSVSAEEISAWDIDVSPDGRGLPPGEGSVQSGEKIYARKCAACHGKNGEGGPFDALVGRIPNDAFPFGTQQGMVKTIGNYWPYATTVYDYINRAMPLDAPGSLLANEVYALTAFLLYKNEIVPVDTLLNAKILPTIKMPSRNRFVPDDRQGGSEVR
jgi:hypothetical protein